MKQLLFLVILVSLSACTKELDNNGQENSENATIELKTGFEDLKTIQEHRDFLESIWDLDQQVRKDAERAVQQKGYHSREHKEIIQKMIETDKENLAKIEGYLAKFGPPRIDPLGELAAQTPFIVIHHSMNLEVKERNFPYIYDAWSKKNLETDEFIFYLDRFYDLKFGKRLKLKNPYTEEDQVRALVTELDLMEFVD